MNGTLAFFQEMGRMVYRNGSWGIDKLNQIYQEMSETIKGMLDEAEQLIELGEAQNQQTLIDRGEALRTFAIRTQNVNNFEAAIKLAEKKSARDFKILDRHKNLLNFKNGTVDLRTGKLKEHDPNDWLTHTLSYNYDPEAECPKWMEFLERIFRDQPEVIPWIQRVCGYAATGETGEQCMVISVGRGSNGKSVLWNTIGHIFDELTGVVPFSTFEKKGANSSSADLASLQGKRLCLVQEGEANTLLSESVIKRATGGSDRLSARHLYRAQMSFYPEFLIVMASNSLPRIRGADEGIWRRVRLNHFNQYITDQERNTHLFYELQEEAEGILNWMVKGAIEYYEKSGLGDPPVIKEATKQYRHGSDELSGFIGEVIVADPEGKVLGKELMGKYLDWCIEQNVKSWSAQALYNAVSERVIGCEKAGSNKGVVLKGIRFATQEDREGMTW
jgi:putative DNA primase/helicase